jgi:hypothetical protein
MRKTIEQHKKDVTFERMSNAIANQVEESGHQIDWDKTICFEKKRGSTRGRF